MGTWTREFLLAMMDAAARRIGAGQEEDGEEKVGAVDGRVVLGQMGARRKLFLQHGIRY